MRRLFCLGTLALTGIFLPACLLAATTTISSTEFLEKLNGNAPLIIAEGDVLEVNVPSSCTITNLSKLAGTGTLRFAGTSFVILRTMDVPQTLTLDLALEKGVQLSLLNVTYEIGSLSGTSGFRTNPGGGLRSLRVVQSRNTQWSNNLTHGGTADNFDTFYLAGAENVSERTLTMSGVFTTTNNLVVEKTGSLRLDGKWTGDVLVAGEFGGKGEICDAEHVVFADGATLRMDWGLPTFTVPPTFEGTLQLVMDALPVEPTDPLSPNVPPAEQELLTPVTVVVAGVKHTEFALTSDMRLVPADCHFPRVLPFVWKDVPPQNGGSGRYLSYTPEGGLVLRCGVPQNVRKPELMTSYESYLLGLDAANPRSCLLVLPLPTVATDLIRLGLSPLSPNISPEKVICHVEYATRLDFEDVKEYETYQLSEKSGYAPLPTDTNVLFYRIRITFDEK